MSLIGSELRDVWNVLRRRRSQYGFYLERVQIKNSRGIEDLRTGWQLLREAEQLMAGSLRMRVRPPNCASAHWRAA